MPRAQTLFALTFALFDTGCGGAVESTDAACSGTNCGDNTNPGVGGASTTTTVGTTIAPGSGGGTTMPGSGGGGGGTSVPVSMIVTQDVPQTSLANLTGVFFTVTDRPGSSTFGGTYSYSAELPTRATEYNYCGRETFYIYTCDTNLPGCLSITINWTMTANATFIGPDSVERYFIGRVDAVKAPLLPVTEPLQYSFIGSFEFTDLGYPNVSLKGNFSVRFDNGSTTTASYIVIC